VNFPSSKSEWADDVFEALDEAFQNINASGEVRSIELENLYLKAPGLAALHRGINDEELIKEMAGHAIRGIEHDLSLVPSSRKLWKFHFVLAYIQSHVPIEIVDELALDRVMDHINDNYDLFHT